MNNFQFIGGKMRCASDLQWAPTLTEHDPNPPITLEHEEEPPAGTTPKGPLCNPFSGAFGGAI